MSTKPNKRRAWEPNEVKTLKDLARKKSGVKAIAKSLGRTSGAIRQKAHSLEISLETRA